MRRSVAQPAAAIKCHGRARGYLDGANRAVGSRVSMNTVLVVLVAAILLGGPSRAQTPNPTPAESAALEQFDTAIAEYMALRRRLTNEIPRPVPNSTSVELNNASDALAGAIQRSRQNAAVGDLFAAPVIAVLKRKVDDALRTPQLRQALAGIDDEAPMVRVPKIHLRFPGAAQMATMPASLLNVFPTLPKELEYRIVGRNLVLRDVDAALILDYIPNVIPR
jgi:hypothetical protein